MHKSIAQPKCRDYAHKSSRSSNRCSSKIGYSRNEASKNIESKQRTSTRQHKESFTETKRSPLSTGRVYSSLYFPSSYHRSSKPHPFTSTTQTLFSSTIARQWLSIATSWTSKQQRLCSTSKEVQTNDKTTTSTQTQNATNENPSNTSQTSSTKTRYVPFNKYQPPFPPGTPWFDKRHKYQEKLQKQQQELQKTEQQQQQKRKNFYGASLPLEGTERPKNVSFGGPQTDHSKEQKPTYESAVTKMKNALEKMNIPEVLSTFHHSFVENNIPPTTEVYNMLIGAYALSEKMNEAFEALEDMKKKNLQPDTKTFNNLIRACQKDITRAFSVFDMITQSNNTPDRDTFNTLIRICGVNQELDKAFEVVASMEKYSLAKGEDTYKSVIAACLDCKDAERAVGQLQEMFENNITPANGLVEDTMFVALSKGNCDAVLFTAEILFQRNVQFLEGVLLEIGALGYRKADARIGEAIKMIVSAQNTPPSAQLYNTLIYIYTATKSWKDVFRFFQESAASGLSNLKGISSFLTYTLSKSVNDLDTAYFALDEMREAGEKIEVISLNVIIAGCLASDEYDRAFATFAAIQQFGASPNTESYNLLLQVCEKNGELSNAFKLYSNAKHEGVVDLETFAILINACCKMNDAQAALTLIEDMKQAGINPSNKHYNPIVKALARREQFEEAYILVQELKNNNIPTQDLEFYIEDKKIQLARRRAELITKKLGGPKF